MGLGCPHFLQWPQAGHTGAALSPLEEPSTRTVPFHLPSSQHKPLHFHKEITKRRPRKVHGTSSACQIKWQQLCACKGFSGGHGHSPQLGTTYGRVLAAATSTCTPTLADHPPPKHGGTAWAQTHLQLPGGLGTSPQMCPHACAHVHGTPPRASLPARCEMKGGSSALTCSYFTKMLF